MNFKEKMMARNNATPSKSPNLRAPGGAQKRTEMVSVRLAPRLRYTADIAARSQRRTLSSLVETAVAAYLPTLDFPEPAAQAGDRPKKLMKIVETLWDPEESDRFVLLAENQRWLMNFEEEYRWKAILDHFKTTRTTLTMDERKALRPIYDEIKERVGKSQNFASR
jgi:hypothetical protein